MRKRLVLLVLSLALLCSCAPGDAHGTQEEGTTIVATTYPAYLCARSVAQGVEDIRVERLNTGSVSCLHDYTLSMNDMKKLEGADVIALSGVELEAFMEDALAASDAAVIDCSAGVELLENLSHHHEEGEEEDHGHDHGHFDPHYWMDPDNVLTMLENLKEGLSLISPEHADQFAQNALSAQGMLDGMREEMEQAIRGWDGAAEDGGLITFHDGFQYFAHAFDLPLLESIEEEAGSEASAKEIVEITELVKAHSIPVIFTEENGSDATAKAISRETGCRVERLSMVMDGPDDGDLGTYLEEMMHNITVVYTGFTGEERAKPE